MTAPPNPTEPPAHGYAAVIAAMAILWAVPLILYSIYAGMQ